jgi:hypothetical protein
LEEGEGGAGGDVECVVAVEDREGFITNGRASGQQLRREIVRCYTAMG